MDDLDGAQTRQLVDTEQVYLAYREARREFRRSYSGSMSWKRVGERSYLYKKEGRDWKSLGPRSARAEEMYERFHDGRDRLRARECGQGHLECSQGRRPCLPPARSRPRPALSILAESRSADPRSAIAISASAPAHTPSRAQAS